MGSLLQHSQRGSWGHIPALGSSLLTSTRWQLGFLRACWSAHPTLERTRCAPSGPHTIAGRVISVNTNNSSGSVAVSVYSIFQYQLLPSIESQPTSFATYGWGGEYTW
jgi:hypothetical protein